MINVNDLRTRCWLGRIVVHTAEQGVRTVWHGQLVRQLRSDSTPRAKPICPWAWKMRAVVRTYALAKSGRRSTKFLRLQAVAVQKKRRACN
jgi:hypothetical protein